MKFTQQNRDRSEELLRESGRIIDPDEIITNPIREWCRAQVGRLLGKPYSPAVPEAISELIDALLTHAESPDHAKRIVDHFCSTVGHCPQPAELMNRAQSTSGVDFQPDPQCASCGGVGWMVTMGGDDQGRAKKCACWRERPIQQTPWQQGRVKEISELPAETVKAHQFGGGK